MKAPDLNNRTPKHHPFKVPAGYFDSLTAKVMASVDQNGQSQLSAKPEFAIASPELEEKKRVPFFKSELYAKLKPYIYMAAMFGGLYFGMWVFKYQQRLTSEKQQTVARTESARQDAASASNDEVYDYINDACDFMMADSHDIIACVTGDDR